MDGLVRPAAHDGGADLGCLPGAAGRPANPIEAGARITPPHDKTDGLYTAALEPVGGPRAADAAYLMN